MINNGFGSIERPKKACNRDISHFLTNTLDDQQSGEMNPHISFQSYQAILQTEGIIKTLWTFRTTFCYHCKISMVLKGTITIEWNG